MPREGRQTICISTQAGCAVDCHFCLTAQLGLIRNLTAGEIVGQVLVALEENREQLAPQTNVVLMGQGEPLLNYDATMAAVRILLDPKGVALAPRHVTLSTSGIVPGIERLGAGKNPSQPGDFAERLERRAAQRAHAHQSQVSAGCVAGRLPAVSAAPAGIFHV